MDNFHFKIARHTLLRLNAYVESHEELAQLFLKGRYNFLQMYQPLIFLDIRTYYKSGKKKEGKKNNNIIGICKASLFAVFASLISLLSIVKILVSHNRILVFSSDKISSSQYRGDFRIEKVYQFFQEDSVAFTEIFHTTFSAILIKNFFQRRRAGFYMEVLDAAYSLLLRARIFPKPDTSMVDTIDLSEFGTDAEFVRGVLKKNIRRIPRSLFKIRILSTLLKKTSVEYLSTIDSVRRYGEIVAACKEANIKVYAIQHGQFTKYQVGWLQASKNNDNIVKPDILFVWSNYWRDELLRLGTYFTEDELVVGGYPRKKEELISKKQALHHSRVNVLIPFETEIGDIKGDIGIYMQAIRECLDLNILFKVRPDISTKLQMDIYNFAYGEVGVIKDMQDAVNQADVVCGVQSTFLYDMVYYKKPVYILKTASDYAEGMLVNNLADIVKDKKCICSVLREGTKMPDQILQERRNRLFDEKPKDLVKTLRQYIRITP